MDKMFFQEKIISLLNHYSSDGDMLTVSGTRAIGYLPEIAPQAYIHVIYPPLEENNIIALQSRIQPLNVHQSLLDLFRCSNGMQIFFKKLFRVFGSVPIGSGSILDHFKYPSDIFSINGSMRVKGSMPTEIKIVWYLEDSSYVNLEGNGNVFRYRPASPKQFIQQWPDIKSWLSSEIERLHSEWSLEFRNSVDIQRN